MLQTLAAARMLTATGPVGQTHWTDSTANNPSPPANSADVQLKQELGAIFKKIGDKQTSTIGLYDLYHITKAYPKVIDMLKVSASHFFINTRLLHNYKLNSMLCVG